MAEKRQQVNGRKAALEALDCMLADVHNIQKLTDSLQERFDDNPALFFEEMVIPLTPKESLVKLGGDPDNKSPVRLILSGDPDEPISIAPAEPAPARYELSATQEPPPELSAGEAKPDLSTIKTADAEPDPVKQTRSES